MKIRPYLTYPGTCRDAIELYKKAFHTDVIQVMYFSDLPKNPAWEIPEDYLNRVVQATLKLGDDFIRMSDCGPGQPLQDPESERMSIAVETSAEEVKHAFGVFVKAGSRVTMELASTFYSPCAGDLYDPFGVMWKFVAEADHKGV